MADINNVDYDVVVIGGGPIGLATAYNCSKRGQKVLVLEKSVFYNGGGSSGDFVRMLRTMYTEDFMADLAKECLGLWNELSSDSGEGFLVWMNGLLNFGDPNYGAGGPEGTLLDPIKNLDRLNMPYTLLNSQEIMEKYPFKNLPDTFQGIFAPDNGVINVPLLLRTLYRLSAAHGTRMVQWAEAYKIDMNETKDGCDVSFTVTDTATDTKQQFTCFGKKIAITSGAYSNLVLSNSFDFKLDLDIWEMAYNYYNSNPGPNGCTFPSMWFQFLGDTNDDPNKSNLFYGFPAVPWGVPNAQRIAVDAAVRKIKDPSERETVPSQHDVSLTNDFVKNHCIGVEYDTPCFTGSALQTNVYDNMYVLDFIPNTKNRVAIFCAGWAMKLVPLLGKALTQLLLDGKTEFNISHFSITRGDGCLMIPNNHNPPKLFVSKPTSSSMHHTPKPLHGHAPDGAGLHHHHKTSTK